MNTTAMRYTLRDIGWLRKAAGELRDSEKTAGIWSAISNSVPYVALGAGIASTGIALHHIMKDKETTTDTNQAISSALDDIRRRENKRELIGALNDKAVRTGINNMYNMVGVDVPQMPMMISKEVSPEYRKAIGGTQDDDQ